MSKLFLIVLLLAALLASYLPTVAAQEAQPVEEPSAMPTQELPSDKFPSLPTDDSAMPNPNGTTQPDATPTALPSAEAATPAATQPEANVQATGRIRIFLPVVLRSPGSTAPSLVATSPFGIETFALGDGRVAEQARQLGASWIRINFLSWKAIEASPGVYNWNTPHIQQFEQKLAAAAAANLTPMVVVDDAPAWATIVPKGCAPIRPERLGNFATFMQQLVTRYKSQVIYWELGNEPDVDVNHQSGNEFFGCWGDPKDPYYGGGYYAEMLKRVYPAIKAANPQAQVVHGGLLLDCDPGRTSPCPWGKFFEGVLRNGGGAAFDILAYHAYAYWNPNLGDPDLESPKWNHRGGVLLGKLSFLRETMRRYNVDKPVIMNEGGSICFNANPICSGGDAYYQGQSNQAVRLFVRTAANGLLGSIWYTLEGPGWRDGGLLDSNQNPRPAFRTMQFLSGLLRGSSYAGQLSSGAVEGYAFRKGTTTYQIFWTNDRSTVTRATPAGTRATYNRLGQRSSPAASLSISPEPVIVEIVQ
jgi:hypothetical protein